MHKLSTLLIDVDEYEEPSNEELLKDWLFTVAYNYVMDNEHNKGFAILDIKARANNYLKDNLAELLDLFYSKSHSYYEWLKNSGQTYQEMPQLTYLLNVYDVNVVITTETDLFLKLINYVKKTQYYMQEAETSVDLYAEDYTTENNWYYPCFKLLRDGTIIRFFDNDTNENTVEDILYDTECNEYEFSYVDDWDLFDLICEVDKDNRWLFVRKYLTDNLEKKLYLNKPSGEQKLASITIADTRHSLEEADLFTMLEALPHKFNLYAVVYSYLFMKDIILNNSKYMPGTINKAIKPDGVLTTFEEYLNAVVPESLDSFIKGFSDSRLKVHMKIMRSLQYCNYPPFSIMYQRPEAPWPNFDYRADKEAVDVDDTAAIVFFDVHY